MLAMKTGVIVLIGMVCCIPVFPIAAPFVAYNDDGEFPSHPFTTRYSLNYFDQGNVPQGPLRAIHAIPRLNQVVLPAGRKCASRLRRSRGVG